jgi:hypothetical protein
MTKCSRVAGVLLLAVCVLAAGCRKQCPLTRLSQDDLVAEYNRNAEQIPRLWARAKMQITLANGLTLGSVSPLANPNGLLLLEQQNPHPGQQNFVLIGRESLAMEIFRLGCNAEQGLYYFWYNAGDYGGEALWGHQALAGAPNVKSLPLDPNQLLGVLGISILPSDFTHLPTVALSMTHQPGEWIDAKDACAYVLTYIDRQPVSQRIGFRREIYFTWAKDQPARPYLVKLFNQNGERVMVAKLSDYRPIQTDSDPAPIMPTRFEIDWPANKTRIVMVLSEMSTEDKWDIEATEFSPPESIQVDKIIQVDRATGE